MILSRLSTSTIVLVISTMAGATPQVIVTTTAAHPPREVEARDIISVTMYKDGNWVGQSKTFSIQTQDQCYGLDGTPGWSNVISSIRVPNGYRCRLWDSDSCNGDSTPDIYQPGAQALPANMNDKTTSFKCYKN